MIRRRPRSRIDADPIGLAWDAGSLPPAEAFMAENRELVLDCLYFRWAESSPTWAGPHHPHQSQWLAALEATKC